MRKIINISLPKELNILVEKEVENGHFASKSEFFRSLLRAWQEERFLLNEVRKSEKEFAEGKGKILHSLKDLR